MERSDIRDPPHSPSGRLRMSLRSIRASAPHNMLELFPSPTAGPFGRKLKRERGARVPVIVVTGFLGAGKTTLVRHFLSLPEGADTAVIVNEFGETGIDNALLRSSSDNIALLGNGCLCCNVRCDLQVTLHRPVAYSHHLCDRSRAWRRIPCGGAHRGDRRPERHPHHRGVCGGATPDYPR